MLSVKSQIEFVQLVCVLFFPAPGLVLTIKSQLFSRVPLLQLRVAISRCLDEPPLNLLSVSETEAVRRSHYREMITHFV